MTRMKSRFGSGWGRGQVDGAGDVLVLEQEVDGASVVLVVHPGDVLAAVTLSAAQSKAHQSQQHGEDAAAIGAHGSGLMTIDVRRAILRVAGVGDS